MFSLNWHRKIVIALGIICASASLFARHQPDVFHGKKAFKEYVGSGEFVLVKFGAPWCGPCTESSPRFKELSAQYPSIVFIELDTQKHPDIGAEHNIASLPTLVLYDKQGNEIARQAGAAADIKMQIDRMLLKMPEDMRSEKPAAQRVVKRPDPEFEEYKAAKKIEKDVATNSSSIKTVTTPSEYGAIVAGSQLPIVIQYFSSTCHTCKSITEFLTDLAPSLAGKAQFVRIDVDNKDLHGVIQERGIAILLPGQFPKYIFGAEKMKGQPLSDKEKKSITRRIKETVAEYHISK